LVSSVAPDYRLAAGPLSSHRTPDRQGTPTGTAARYIGGMDDANPIDARAPLLSPDEPPVAERINVNAGSALVLSCDHASRRVPHALGNLGLHDTHFERHIAYDIGAEGVTRILSENLDATAVLAGYSRLVVDLNRPPGHPTSMPEVSDETLVPGNQGLTAGHVTDRLETFFEPYHRLVQRTMTETWLHRRPPVLFSVHSFSPRFGGSPRPWDIGVLWNHDPRIAKPLIKALHDRGLDVGDNLPYSGKDVAYTIDAHAGSCGLANCVIEINQDQVADDAGVRRWGGILSEVLDELLRDEDLYKVEYF
jgi:predicted N-formylglutamate amidohydrolase